MPLKSDKPKTVEDYLNAIDFSTMADYIPSNAALEFAQFIKMVNGPKGEENKTPPMHYMMLDNIFTKDERNLNMLFRGAAKTSVFGEYLILYLAVYEELPVFGPVDLGLYVSDSIDNGVKNMRKNLEFRYEESEFLQQYIQETKFTDTRWEFRNINNNTLIFKGYGAKTGVRGTKEKAKRPQLAILDDLLDDESAASPAMIKKIEDVIYNGIEHALHPTRRKMIWSGTPFNKSDPFYKAAESGSWVVNVFPVASRFPVPEEEFDGAWPDRFPYEMLRKAYNNALKDGKLRSFNQELMLRITNDDEKLIRKDDIGWYNRSQLIRNRHNYSFIITTDFATSASKYADYTVISVWALGAGGYIYWVDGICERQLMDKTVTALFRLAKKYRPTGVGIEGSGQQGGYIPWIERQMLEENTFFSFLTNSQSKKKGIYSTEDKLSKFQRVIPLILSGKLRFPSEMQGTKIMDVMEEEITNVTPQGFMSATDDFSDTISMLGMVDLNFPGADYDDGESVDDVLWGNEDSEDDYDSALSSYIT